MPIREGQYYTLIGSNFGGGVLPDSDTPVASVIASTGWTPSSGTVTSVLNTANLVDDVTSTIVGGASKTTELRLQLKACPTASNRVMLGYVVQVVGEIGWLTTLAATVRLHIRVRGTEGSVERSAEVGTTTGAGPISYGHNFTGGGGQPGDVGLYWDNSKGVLDFAPEVDIWFETDIPITSGGVQVDVKLLMVQYVFLDLQAIDGKFFFPPHIKYAGKPIGVSAVNRLATMGYSPNDLDQPNYPDLFFSQVQEVVSSSAATQPSGDAESLGVRVITKDDGGPQVQAELPDTNHQQASLSPLPVWIHKQAYLVPGQDQFIWTDPKRVPVVCMPDKPYTPVLTATLEEDGVRLQGYSRDNLLPGYYGSNGLYETDTVFAGASSVDRPLGMLASLATGWTASWQLGLDSRQAWRVRMEQNGVSNFSASLGAVPVQAGKQYRVAVGLRVGGGAGTQSMTLSYNILSDAGVSLQSGSTADNVTTSGTNIHHVLTANHDGWLRLTVQSNVFMSNGHWVELYDPAVHRAIGDETVDQYAQGGYLWGNAWPKLHGLYLSAPVSGSDVAVRISPAVPITYNPTSIEFDTSASTEYIVEFVNEVWGLPPDWPGTLRASMRAKVSYNGVTGSPRLSLGLRFLDSDWNLLDETWEVSSATPSTTHRYFAMTELHDVPEDTVYIQPLLFWGQISGSGNLQVSNLELYFNTLPPPPDIVGCSGGTQMAWIETPCSWTLIERRFVGANQTTPWATVAALWNDPVNDFDWTDHILPENMQIEYRARVVGMLNGELMYSDYTDVESVGPDVDLSNDRWTLWDPTHTLLQEPLRFDIGGRQPTLKQELPSAVGRFSPVGRDRRVITSDISKGRIFQMEINSIDADELALWQSLHPYRDCLILTRASTGEVWPVALTSNIRIVTHNTNPTMYDIEVELEEIDVPPVW